MRRLGLRASCLAAALLLGGCAHLERPPAEFNETAWQTLLDQQRYRSAMLMLEIHPLEPPQREELVATLERRAAQRRRALIREAQRLAEAGEFRRADALLAEAMPEQLETTELEAARAQLERKVTLREQRALGQIYLLHGQQLLAATEPLARLERFAASVDAQRLLQEHRDDRQQVAARLVTLGKAALKRGEYGEAVSYLQTAHRLDATVPVDDALAAARRGQAQVASQERQAVARARQKIYEDLQVQIEAALADADYAEALARLQQLERLGINTEATVALRRRVETTVANYTARAMHEGDRYYADGAIERALTLWETAHAIAPSEELAGRIGKAQRFLERYRELRQPPS